MKLKKIRIHNFLNLKGVEIEIQDQRALVVGCNGAGKTNIIKLATYVIQKFASQYYNVQLTTLPAAVPFKKYLHDSYVEMSFQFAEHEWKFVLEYRFFDILLRCKKLWEEMHGYFTPRNDAVFQKIIRSKLFDFIREKSGLEPRKAADEQSEFTIKWSGVGEVSHEFHSLLDTLSMDHEFVEQQLITLLEDGFKELFGDNALKLKVNELYVEKIIKRICDQKDFLNRCFSTTIERGPPQFFCSLSLGSDIHEAGGYFETLEEIFQGVQINDRHRLLIHPYFAYLLYESFCVVGQHRGLIISEWGEPAGICWSMEKIEKAIVSAYLSEKGSFKSEQLEKVKEAMLLMAGLNIDVTRKAVKSEESKEQEQPYVILRQCNSPEAEWRRVMSYSGGQQELLLVLSAVHLSNADTVILDEPGRSLHPPKKAQLRRWFETRCDKRKGIFVITHSTEMVSPKWLGSLYHLKPDDNGYKSGCLRETTNVKEVQTSLTETASHNLSVSSENTTHLSSAVIDFLMGVEVRRLFFSSGAIFVEGDSDRRAIHALRDIALEKAEGVLQDDNSSLKMYCGAHKELEIDRWDIIPINGCANLMKAHTASTNLGVPFVVILDADVLKCDKSKAFSKDNWKKSRLESVLRSDGMDGTRETVENIEKILETSKDPLKDVRAELSKINLWVWDDDLEALFFCSSVCDELKEIEGFAKFMDEIGCISGDHNACTPLADESNQNSMIDDMKIFVEDRVKGIVEEFDTFMEDVRKNSADLTKVRELEKNNPVKKFGDATHQKLCNYARSLKRKRHGVEQKKDAGDAGESVTGSVDWSAVRKNLHKGGWKKISHKVLKEMVRASYENDVDNQYSLKALWKHIIGLLVDSKKMPRLPAELIERRVQKEFFR